MKVLDCDTIMQVKEKVLDQIYKGTPYGHRPDPDSLDLGEQNATAPELHAGAGKQKQLRPADGAPGGRDAEPSALAERV